MQPSSNIRLAVPVLLFFCGAGQAEELGWTMQEQAAALLATQLSAEVGNDLVQSFRAQGKPADVAEATAFQVINLAASCSVGELQHIEMPQVESFLDLLVKNDQISSVTHALSRMYEPNELDEMQAEVSRIVQACLQRAESALG